MGDRRSFIENATEKLSRLSVKPLTVSSLYESEPWGFSSDMWFLNRAVLLRTQIEAPLLLRSLLEIESSLGRIREHGGERCIGYSSRTIDMDILLYGDLVLNTRDLQIPHPRLHERRFALMPMAEIAGNVIHPVLKKTIDELLRECSDNGLVKKWE
jgi:2-amino-4-hydroxy-6-hydroxymethyldihydropteridine diphosphokinase